MSNKIEVSTQIKITIENDDGTVTLLELDNNEARVIYAKLKDIFDRDKLSHYPVYTYPYYPTGYPPYHTYTTPPWYASTTGAVTTTTGTSGDSL